MNLTYRSEDGLHLFSFRFEQTSDHIEIYCQRHPSIVGVSTDVAKTHIWPSGRLCFVSGHEPSTAERARQLAAQWAEYILDYRRTGVPQR